MGMWTKGAPSAWPLFQDTVHTRLGNTVHFFRGEDSYGKPIYQGYYTLSNNTWTSSQEALPALPADRYMGCMGAGETVYLFVNPDRNNWNTQEIWAYNTRTKTTTPKKGWIDYLKMGASAGLVERQGIIYILGGLMSYDDDQGDYSVNTVAAYNTATDTRTYLPSMPNDRAYFQPVIIGDKMYCVGGLHIKSGSSNAIPKVDMYDFTTGAWTTLKDIGTARYGFSAETDGAALYVIGGYTADQSSPTLSCEEYTIGTDTWSYMESMPFGYIQLDTNSRGYYYSQQIFSGPMEAAFAILDLRVATITNPAPTSGFIQRKTANTFTWTLESKPAGTEQRSATFQWRTRGSGTAYTINVGETQSVTIPANTFPSAEIEWRVSATNAVGIVAPFTEWFLLTTIDARPGKPTGLYPNSGSRDGTKAIQFSWLHNSPLSTPQSAFELQITYDSGYTWKSESGKVSTAATQFIAAANTITPTDQAGRVGWRVRTYNSDGVASEWSDTAFFIVHPAPQTPTWVSVEANKSRPLCRWISTGQTGFHLQVLTGESIVYDSGEIPGTETGYKIPTYLSNGVFNFRVRIKNTRGLESAWANRAVTINAAHSLNIILSGAEVTDGARLSFEVEVKPSG